MEFAVYEEFPTEENLEKLTNLNFPVDIIVASRNLAQFQDLKRQIEYTNGNVKRVGYWPILAENEGYWISPFSKKEALERIISELEERSQDDDKLLLKWDAELPLSFKEARKLFYSELNNFFKNKIRIQNFLKQHASYGLDLMTAEWPTFMLPEFLQESFGVAFNPNLREYNSEKGRMLYSSFRKYFYGAVNEKIVDGLFYKLFKKQIKKGVEDYGNRFWVGIGCLASGILKTEPLTTLSEFEKDLKTAKEHGAEKILVFRLGGISKSYAEIIRNYLS